MIRFWTTTWLPPIKIFGTNTSKRFSPDDIKEVFAVLSNRLYLDCNMARGWRILWHSINGSHQLYMAGFRIAVPLYYHSVVMSSMGIKQLESKTERIVKSSTLRGYTKNSHSTRLYEVSEQLCNFFNAPKKTPKRLGIQAGRSSKGGCHHYTTRHDFHTAVWNVPAWTATVQSTWAFR